MDKQKCNFYYNKWLLILGASLGFPLFFTTNLSVFKGDVSSYEFSIPISFFATFFCFVVFGWRCIASFLRLPPLFLLISFAIAALNAAVQIGGGDWSLFFVYFGPTIFGFFLAWAVKVNANESALSVFIGFACAVTISAALHLISSFVSHGIAGALTVRGEDSIFGLFSIYQKYIYYPTILAIGFCLVSLFFNGLLRLVASFILVIDILLTGSREALLLCLFFYLLIEFKKINNGLAILRSSVQFLCILGLMIIFLLYFTSGNIDDIPMIAKLVTILESEDINSMTAGRYDVIFEVSEVFDMEGFFFLFGSGFRTDIGQLGTPHNQYVEWYLRGGVVFALANIFMICWSIYRHFLIGGRIHYAAGIVLISALLISNNINTPFRVPYTSVFFWFLIGLSFVPKHSFFGVVRRSKYIVNTEF